VHAAKRPHPEHDAKMIGSLLFLISQGWVFAYERQLGANMPVVAMKVTFSTRDNPVPSLAQKFGRPSTRIRFSVQTPPRITGN
jgi:hypothetical protein